MLMTVGQGNGADHVAGFPSGAYRSGTTKGSETTLRGGAIEIYTAVKMKSLITSGASHVERNLPGASSPI